MEPLTEQEDPLWRALVAVVFAVLVSIALLGSLVFVPRAMREQFATKCSKAKADIMIITQSIDQYAIENNGKYPDSLKVLVVPDETGFSYLGQATVLTDPWGQEYLYKPPPPGTHEYRVFTYGSDGTPGGEGDARDFDNIMIRKGEV